MFNKHHPVSRIVRFQSHIGAIRIGGSKTPAFYLYLFQSHIGAIRITMSAWQTTMSVNFNPTLVQLEW